MRRAAFFTMAALSGAAALGQGLLDCVAPDVLHALLLRSQGERAPVITAAVPSEISTLRMPGGFVWIGSAERIAGRVDATTNAVQVTAAWRSSLTQEAAQSAAAAALTASGWEVQPRPGAGMRVFNSASSPEQQVACRDGKPINFSASIMDGVTYVLLNVQRANFGSSVCNQPVRPMNTFSTALDPYLPRLEMPVDRTTGLAARLQGGGSGTSAGAFDARTEFTIKDSAVNVAQHFAKQMAEQGWTSDASWSGASTAGSSWSRRPGAGALVQSTLSVTALDEQQFVAVLRIVKLQ